MVNVPFWAAVVMNVAGNVAASLGTNIIKLGHNKIAAMNLPKDETPPVWKTLEWVIGFAVFLTGNIVTNVSFVFGAQSVLAALGSTQLVANVVFCYFILHEPVTFVIIVTTGCIISGCILLVIFGNHSSETFTVPILLDLYTRTPYIIYLVCLVLVSFGMYIVFCHGRSIMKRSAVESQALKAVARTSTLDKIWVTISPLAYSIYSAFIGTQSVVFSKSLTTMLFNGDSWGYWYLYVDAFLFIGTAIFWLRQLNGGIHMFPAMIIVPTLQLMWIFFSILSGLIYFQEYATYTALSYGMFFTGVVIMFGGIYVLLHVAGVQREGYVPMADDKNIQIDNAAFEAQPGDDKRGSTLGMTGMSTFRGGGPSLSRLGSRTSWMGGHDLAASIRSRMSESMLLEKEEQPGGQSLMGTLRKVQQGPKVAVTRMMGLDAGMAAISIFNFSMPADDLYSSRRQHRNTLNATDMSQGGTSTNAPHSGGGAAVLHHSAIEDALPQSRFPKVASNHMPAIVEMEENHPSSFGLAKSNSKRQLQQDFDEAGKDSDGFNNNNQYDNRQRQSQRPYDDNRSAHSGGAGGGGSAGGIRPASALNSRPGSGNVRSSDVDGPNNGGGGARPGSGGGTPAGQWQDGGRDDGSSPTHMRGRPRPPSIETHGIDDLELSDGGNGGKPAPIMMLRDDRQRDNQQQQPDDRQRDSRRDEPTLAGRGWQVPLAAAGSSQPMSRAVSGQDSSVPPAAGVGGALAPSRTSRTTAAGRLATNGAQHDAEAAYRARENALQQQLAEQQQQLAEQQQHLLLLQQQQQQTAAYQMQQQQRSYAAVPPQYNDGVDQYSTPVSSALRASYELLMQRQQLQGRYGQPSSAAVPPPSVAYVRPPAAALRPAGVTWAQTSYETPLLTRSSSTMDPQLDVPRGRAGTAASTSYASLYPTRPQQQYMGGTDASYGALLGGQDGAVRRSTLFPPAHEALGLNARGGSASIHSSSSLSPGTLAALQQRPGNSRLGFR